MNVPLLLTLAVGPALILLHAIYVADRVEKEPIRNLLEYLGAGAVAAIVAGAVERLLYIAVGFDPQRSHWLWLVPIVYLAIGATEELAKRGALYMRARHDPDVNEPFDWLVYAVSVSLGFATLENIEYVLAGGAGVAAFRALTAVPCHALLGTLMGDRLARAARTTGAAAIRQQVLAVVEPILWHGTYDLFAFGLERAAREGAVDLSLALYGALAMTVLLLWVVAQHRVQSQQWRAATRTRVPPILYPTLPFGRHHQE
jgi:RsiW-degrading membrane proteinase PrsW (M82 family)